MTRPPLMNLLLVALVLVVGLNLLITMVYRSIWRTDDEPVDSRARRRDTVLRNSAHRPPSTVDLLVSRGVDLRSPEAALGAIQEILRYPTGWTRIDVEVQRILDEHYRQDAEVTSE